MTSPPQAMPAKPAPTAARRAKRALLRVGVFVAVLYAGWCGTLYVLQDRLIFPRQIIPTHDTTIPPGAVELSVEHEAGRTPGLLLLPVRREPGQRFPLVVWCHGNAETIDQDARIDQVDLFLRRRMAVLLPEYRGYGRADGTPSEAAIVADAVALMDAALARPEIDGNRTVIFGRSLGGGVAVQAARQRPPRALILQCTFTSIASFAAGYGVPGFIVRSPFRTDRVLPTLDVPVLIMHGDRDTIVPVEHGRRLRDLARRATYFEQACDHLDFPSDFDDYERRIHGFLDELGLAGSR